MNLIRLLISLLMLAYCASKSREKCIKHLLKSCMKRVKGKKGCAVFYKRPIIPDYMDFTGWYFKSRYCSFLGPWFFVVAIPNHQKGRWVELNGDGGYINWQFDPEAFHRIGNRIILK